MSEDAIQVMTTEASGIVVWAQNVAVVDKTSADAALTQLAHIKTLRQKWVSYWEPLKKAANDSWKQIVAKEKEGTSLCDVAETEVKRKVTAWQIAERSKAEAEQRRLQAEADERARRERERLEKEAAKLKTPELREQRLAEAASVAAPVVMVQAEIVTAAGAQLRKTFKAEVVDMVALIAAATPGSVAASFLEVNQQAANAFARSTKGAVAVPGVKFVAVESLSSKAM